jgi:hypothetical protein
MNGASRLSLPVTSTLFMVIPLDGKASMDSMRETLGLSVPAVK